MEKRSAGQDGVAAFLGYVQPRILGALSLYVGDRAVAEELTHETLASICDRWEMVAQMRSPEGWSLQVALNRANSWFRRRRAERRAQHTAAAMGQTRSDDRADSVEVVALRAAVAALPKRQRMSVVLRYYLDLPVSQTAEIMQCAPGTVTAATHQTMAALRGKQHLFVAAEVTDDPEIHTLLKRAAAKPAGPVDMKDVRRRVRRRQRDRGTVSLVAVLALVIPVALLVRPPQLVEPGPESAASPPGLATAAPAMPASPLPMVTTPAPRPDTSATWRDERWGLQVESRQGPGDQYLTRVVMTSGRAVDVVLPATVQGTDSLGYAPLDAIGVKDAGSTPRPTITAVNPEEIALMERVSRECVIGDSDCAGVKREKLANGAQFWAWPAFGGELLVAVGLDRWTLVLEGPILDLARAIAAGIDWSVTEEGFLLLSSADPQIHVGDGFAVANHHARPQGISLRVTTGCDDHEDFRRLTAAATWCTDGFFVEAQSTDAELLEKAYEGLRIIEPGSVAQKTPGPLACVDATAPNDTQSSSVTVYFLCSDLLPADVRPVTRPVPERTLRAALAELLAGPNAAETRQGYDTTFDGPAQGLLRDVTIDDGLATVDFIDRLSDFAGTTFQNAALVAMLNTTVFEFDEIDAVAYQIEGSSENFCEMVQAGPECMPITHRDVTAPPATWTGQDRSR